MRTTGGKIRNQENHIDSLKGADRTTGADATSSWVKQFNTAMLYHFSRSGYCLSATFFIKFFIHFPHILKHLNS